MFLSCLGICALAQAADVVYLKDGSVIHGMITEEVPGVSIKIQTADGNIFVYKVKAIAKITHSADNAGDATNSVVQPGPKATPAPVVDPNARFSKFGFFVSGGFWGTGGTQQFNADLESGTGSTDYDFLPGWFKLGLGLGWYTNNIALKWDFQGTIQPNDYTTDYYYGGFYSGSTTEDTYLMFGGTELELDLGLDSITNKDNVMTFYIPLIVGAWEEEYSFTTDAGSDTFDGTCTDFGSGIGIRAFDSSNFLWDCQLVYRGSSGSYLKDANGNEIPYVKGKFVYADVSGLDLNFQLGFLFQ